MKKESNKWTTDLLLQFKNDVELGKSIKELCSKYNISKQRVYQLCRKHDVKIRLRQSKERVCGLNVKALQESLNDTSLSLLQILQRFNISKYSLDKLVLEGVVYVKESRAMESKEILISRLITAAKARSPIDSDLSWVDLKPFPTHCPVFGFELVYGNKNRQQDNSASLDRLDPSKGYVKGNVYIISYKANRLKSDGVLEDFKNLVRYLESLKVNT